jgi:L-threonylcarbamoyladenylate synthase
MSARYDCTDPAQRTLGVEEAAAAVRKGELAVMPTDTVYGVAADAFSPVAVATLLAVKGRGRQAPPPVLVGTVRAAMALVEDVNAAGKDLIEEFWPGGLTLVLRANRGLAWDLGDTKGTVAVRMPMHPVALEVLRETGPLAVSSANLTGQPPAVTAAEAEAQLGESIAVYLDDGRCPGNIPSTIVDLTGPIPRLLRRGAIPADRLRRVVALIGDEEPDEDGATPDAADPREAAPYPGGPGEGAAAGEAPGDAAPGDAAPGGDHGAAPAAAAPDGDEPGGALPGEGAPRGGAAGT